MNQFDYIFLKYIDRFYQNVFLEKLIEQYEKGLSKKERRKSLLYVNKFDKPRSIEHLLFLYIMFKRTARNGYIDELAKELSVKLKDTPNKEWKKKYKQLNALLELLEIPPLEVSKQVVKNINEFT